MHTHALTRYRVVLFFLLRIRGFVAVGVCDESRRQITALQTAFKLLPLQPVGALITDNSFLFNKEFWRTPLLFCLKLLNMCTFCAFCMRPIGGTGRQSYACIPGPRCWWEYREDFPVSLKEKPENAHPWLTVNDDVVIFFSNAGSQKQIPLFPASHAPRFDICV